MKLILIPPGSFTMGSPMNEADRDKEEAQVGVTLTESYWLGEREVTQSEWQRVVHSTPWIGKEQTQVGDNFPANYLDWQQAMSFCQELTAADRRAGRLPSGFEYTLPTEAQWEYACRAGTTTRFSFGDDDSRLGDYAWFDQNAFSIDQGYPHEVATKKPNPWGLYDMHGNSWEWCRDWFADRLPGGTDPEVSTGGANRVMRGGCVARAAKDCRSASRGLDTPSNQFARLGLRVALSRAGYGGAKTDDGSRRDAELRSTGPATNQQTDARGLKGSYFRGENFETRVLERIDPQIDFLWFFDAPDPSVPSEHFSVRWEGWLKAPAPGDYHLAVLCDDGVRISLDGKRLIDAWNRVYATRRDVLVRMTDKPSRLLVEYFQANGPALVTLRWSLKDRFDEQPISGASLFVTQAAAENAVVPMPPHRERTQGLRFDLYREKEMERKMASTIASQVDFAWGRPAPVLHMFAMRWSGWLKPPVIGQYRFVVSCDDGIRLSLGGKTVLNEWRPKKPRRYEFEERFANLQPIPVRIDHFGSKSSAGIVSVRWIPPGAKTPEIIPIEAWQLAEPADRASHPAGDRLRLQAPQPARGPRPASTGPGL